MGHMHWESYGKQATCGGWSPETCTLNLLTQDLLPLTLRNPKGCCEDRWKQSA